MCDQMEYLVQTLLFIVTMNMFLTLLINFIWVMLTYVIGAQVKKLKIEI